MEKLTELEKVVKQLQPGYIYLTLGSIQQLSVICNMLNLTPHLLIEPNRHELVNSIEFFNYSSNCFILVLKELKTSSKEKVASDYTLPSNLKPYCDTYTFVPLIGIQSEITKATKKAAQSLEGGFYKVLDLRNLGLDLFPFNSFNPSPSLSSPFPIEQDFIYSLLTPSGTLRWASFTHTQLRQWFSTPGQPEPILLIRAKATSLIPFIMPYCNALDFYWHKNPSSILLRFAIWVFCSTHIWHSKRFNGLTVSKNNAGETIFYCNPSPKARLEWSKDISQLYPLTPLPSKLKKEQNTLN